MKTHKGIYILILVLLLMLAGALTGAYFYLRGESNRTTYFGNTTINGYDVTDLSVDEAYTLLVRDYSKPSVSLHEGGEAAISGSLKDFGYAVDEAQVKDSLEQALEAQKTNVLTLVESLMNGNAFQITVKYTFDQNVFNNKVNAAALPKARVKSVDAQMQFNDEKSEYEIVPETYGTEFADGDLQNFVKAKIDEMTASQEPAADLTIDFPEDIYVKPAITQDDATLNSEMNQYNQYTKAKITYQFGSDTQVLDWNTIQDWMYIPENGSIVLDYDQVKNYVATMAAETDTRYYQRTFHTSTQGDITIEGDLNTYGYTINQDEEFNQLIADIQSNTPVEREPVYYSTTQDGFATPVYLRRGSRDKADDLGGNYIEVSISQQHLWMYKDYQLVVETPVVTGNVSKNHGTHTGVYPLAFKESPSTLSGQDGPNGYEVEVKYWMPFADGQGLHDADWRSSFGGNTYLTNGSHGCVNCPPSVMGQIFENAEAGMAVIVY